MSPDEHVNVPNHIESYIEHIESGGFKSSLSCIENHHEIQLNFAISAFEHSISSQILGNRMIECFREFNEGIGYASDKPSESVNLYSEAFENYFNNTFSIGSSKSSLFR
jgi:hypothetical protein